VGRVHNPASDANATIALKKPRHLSLKVTCFCGYLRCKKVLLKKARALLRSGEYSKVQVAGELEAGRHTLWRALWLEKTK